MFGCKGRVKVRTGLGVCDYGQGEAIVTLRKLRGRTTATMKGEGEGEGEGEGV